MVLRKLFGNKKDDTAAKDIESEEIDSDEVAEIVPPDVDAKLAEVINENVEGSVAQKQKEAESNAEEKEKMADKSESGMKAGANEEKRKLRPEVRPHAFVVMPFGKKKGGDGSQYDFNAIYQSLIKPALEQAGGKLLFKKNIGVPLWPFVVFVVVIFSIIAGILAVKIGLAQKSTPLWKHFGAWFYILFCLVILINTLWQQMLESLIGLGIVVLAIPFYYIEEKRKTRLNT